MSADDPVAVRHESGDHPLWSESWYVDFAADSGAEGLRGGFLRLNVFPNLGRSWLWAAWVDDGRLIVVRDHDVPVPRSGLEVRSSGLWADLICETPMTHWTFGLEAFGLSLDDPAAILIGGEAGERGDRVPLGFDLEWEAVEAPFDFPVPAGRPDHGHHQHAGRVHGDVLVADERIILDGWGQRDHFWGVRDWWDVGWQWAGGRAADDLTFSVAHPAIAGAEHATGYVARAGDEARPLTSAVIDTETDAAGLPRRATYALDDRLTVGATVAGVAPFRIPALDGDGESHLIRALCAFRSVDRNDDDEPDVGQGVGWAEWLSADS